MSLVDTREIATAKIVMLGGGGGGLPETPLSVVHGGTGNADGYIRTGAQTGSTIGNRATAEGYQVVASGRYSHAGGLNNIAEYEAQMVCGKYNENKSATLFEVGNGTVSTQTGIQRSNAFEVYSDGKVSFDNGATKYQLTSYNGDFGFYDASGTFHTFSGGSGGDGYAGLGIGKKKTVTNNIIDTDIDLHRAPIVGDRLLIYFDEKVTNPTGLTTYNNGTAVTSNLEPVTPLYINGGWNTLEFKNDGFLYNNCWVRMQNVPIPNNTLSGLSDTAIVSPSDGQMLSFDNSSSKWKNKTIAANNGGTPVRELKTLQIGDAVFDTFGLKTFDVTSVTSGVNGAISVDVITASQLNGEIIAIHTGSNTGSTGNAWTLALSDAQTIEALTMSKADGTAFTDALTANSLMFVKVNTSNDTAVVLGIVGAGTDVEANVGFSDTELKKIKVGNIVYDTDGLRDYSVSSIANNNITVSVLNAEQFVMENIAINTGSYTGSSNAWNLVLSDGTNTKTVALKNADGTAFSDDIHENEFLFVYVDTAGNVARVLDIPVNTTEIKTATGNPITLTDANAGNAIEVSAEIVASQDLHGFDKPWVGGAGKNKLPLTINGIKAINTEGTWSGNTYSKHGVIYELLTDNDGNITGIAISGSASTDTFLRLSTSTPLATGNYILTGGQSAYVYIYIAGVVSNYVDPAPFTVSASPLTSTVGIGIKSGYPNTNTVVYPMIRNSGTSDAWEPYANICPITGFSSVVITDVDAESQTATVTVALGQTVYGGTLNLTTGELTVTHANIASYNGETIGEPWISSLDEYTEGGTPTTGAQVVYTLATPTTITLTAAQLALVKGYNQLSCNSGDMEITYKASGLDALKERVDELEDAVADLETDMASKAEKTTIGTVENGTTASQAYAVGEHFIRNDKFCTAIAAIASGATLTLNTNYVEGTIADNITKRVNYSATEHVIGTWINGETLYEKTINCGNLPNSTEKLIDANIGVNAKAVSLSGMAFDTDGSSWPIVFVFPSDITWSIAAYYYPSNYQTAQYRDKIRLITAKNLSNATAYMTIQYIKL